MAVRLGCRLPGGSAVACALTCGSQLAVDDDELCFDVREGLAKQAPTGERCWCSGISVQEDIAPSFDVGSQVRTECSSTAPARQVSVSIAPRDSKRIFTSAADAVQAIHGLEAWRLLQQSEGESLDNAAKERLALVVQQWEGTERVFADADEGRNGWYADPRGSSRRIGFCKPDPGCFQTLLAHTYDAPSSPELCVAALLENDLMRGYKPNVTSAQLLHQADAMCSLWQIFQVGAFSKRNEDNIAEVFTMDMLDEPAACVWIYVRTLPATTLRSEACNCDIPAATPGADRFGGAWTEFRVKPLASGGCSLSILGSMPVSGALAAFSNMPQFLLKRAVAQRAEEAAAQLLQHLQSAQLRERVRSAEARHFEFYERMRRRFRGESGDAEESGSLDSTCTAESLPTSLSPDDAAADEDAHLAAWRALAAELPTSWAEL